MQRFGRNRYTRVDYSGKKNHALEDLRYFSQNADVMILGKIETIVFFAVILVLIAWAVPVSAVMYGVKFNDDSGIVLRDNRLVSQDGQIVFDPGKIIVNVPGTTSCEPIQLQRVFNRSNEQLDLERQHILSQGRRQSSDLTQCFYLNIPETSLSAVRDVLFDTGQIDFFYKLPDVLVPADFISSTPDLTGNQEHLFDVDGPHIARAWNYEYGTGAGVTIVDIEGGCFRFHEDLEHKLGNDAAVIGGICSNEDLYRYHGTAVAGLLVAGDNGFGVTGMCPDATMKLYFCNIITALPSAINESQAAIEPGDIILIEMQVEGPRYPGDEPQEGLLPVEWDNMTRLAIANAVALDRIIIQCAGNGRQDLDDPLYADVFGPDATDTGSIIVSASKPGTFSATSYSNYGSRVNLQGWSERLNPCCQLWSTGYPDGYGTTDLPLRSYTRFFSGTSSAAAMVAGIATCLQSAGKYRQNEFLTPDQLRHTLRITGTSQSGSKIIGPLPDIAAAIESIPFVDVSVDLMLNQPMFTSGDPFVLSHVTVNPRAVRHVSRYLALQCVDQWFFMICSDTDCTWVDYGEASAMLLQPGNTEEILLSFTWPHGNFGTVTPGSGYAFYLAYFDLWTAEFIGNYDGISFGWQ